LLEEAINAPVGYLESPEDEFAFEAGAAGVLPVEELPWGSGCADEGAFPGVEYGLLEPDGVGALLDCGVGFVPGGGGLSAAGVGEVAPLAGGLVAGAPDVSCPEGVGAAVAGDGGLDCPSTADGLGLGDAGFKEGAGAGGCACTGKTTEFTTEGSS
jgi:hypothetical protein